VKKRSSFDVQLKILKTIYENQGITMTSLERKIRTNPASLREHCEHLDFFELLHIKKEPTTQKIYLTKEGENIVRKIQDT